MTEESYTTDDEDDGPPALPSTIRGGTIAWLGHIQTDDRVDNPTDVAILSVLAEHLSADGDECWPKIATIAARSRVSPNTVKRHLSRLVELGVVSRVRLRQTEDVRRLAGYRYRFLPCGVANSLGTTPSEPGDSLEPNLVPRGEDVPVSGSSLGPKQAPLGTTRGPAYPPTRSEDPNRGSTSGRAGDNHSPRHRPVEEVLAERPPVDRDLNLAGVARLRSQFGPQA